MTNWLKNHPYIGSFVGVCSAVVFYLALAQGVVDAFSTVKDSTNVAMSWMNDINKIKPNDIAVKQAEAVIEAEECDFDPKQWQEGTGKLVDVGTTYTMTREVYSSTIRYEKSISSNTNINFTFTPKSEEIKTVVVVHGLYEVVIGDSDIYGTTFKANTGSTTVEQVGDRLIAKGGIKVGNDVTVVVVQHLLARGEFEVVLSIDYTRADTGTQNTISSTYHFPIPADFKKTKNPIRLSLGFINVNNVGAISADFKCFSAKTSALETTEEVARVP